MKLRTPSKPVVLLLILLALFLGLSGWLLLRGGSGGSLILNAFFYFSEETRYADGYSHENFYSVQVGDDEARVRELLGAPLSDWGTEPRLGWVYSDGRIPAYEERGFLPGRRSFTEFSFGPSGTVRQVFGQIHKAEESGFLSTSNSISFGAGQNYLGLSDERIEELKGKTMAEIEALFGKPASTFRSDVVIWLQYSDSPTSTDYRQRLIGLDATGRVAWIRDDNYYD